MNAIELDDDTAEFIQLYQGLPEKDKPRLARLMRAVATGDEWAEAALMAGRDRGLDFREVLTEFERYHPASTIH